ncbi:MAG: acyltransferase family protein [Desulfarculaceae bacterium]|jgi:hypothetical protein
MEYRAQNREGQGSLPDLGSDTLPGKRLIFFDNLRYLLVLFVVVEHSANAYNGLNWWPVAESEASFLAQGLSAFSDVFAMPLLFYIAGYFALPNLQKKGVSGFLVGKLKRLGIPWLVCILTICPILPLIYHYTRNGLSLSQSYGDLWLELMHKALEFNVGVIPSLNQLMASNQFYQRYMWFLSLLLLFFLGFALLYALGREWLDAPDKAWEKRSATARSTLVMLLCIGGLTTLLSFPSVGLMMALTPKLHNPEPFFSLGNLIQFRPSRFFFYLIYFGLGVITYRNKWIQRGWFPGNLKTWMVSFALLLAAFLVAVTLLRSAPPELKGIYAPVYFFVLNFLCAACLGLSLAWGLRYWNHPNARDRSLAANSYNIYLSHYVFVVTAQLILFPLTAVPATLKFLMVAASSGVLAYVSSRWLISSHPRLAVASAFALLLAMTLGIRP